MTVEEVISAGESTFTNFLEIAAFVLIVLLTVIVITVVFDPYYKDQIVVCVFAVLFISIVAGGFILSTYHHKAIDEWKDEVARPYIQSLPIEKKEVLFIKVESSISSETEKNRFTTSSKVVKKTPITVSYKEDDGSVVTETNWVEAKMILGEDEKPYLEFQRLTKDLGHGLNSGIYNLKVQLPKDYTFNEIK